ncbi:hypothetical protein ACEQPO_26665 [Bacillus sp. SL00103]
MTNCRLDKIKKLLKDSSLSLKEIPIGRDIQIPITSSRVFKKMVGCSPKEYRKTDRKKMKNFIKKKVKKFCLKKADLPLYAFWITLTNRDGDQS